MAGRLTLTLRLRQFEQAMRFLWWPGGGLVTGNEEDGLWLRLGVWLDIAKCC